MRSPTNMDLMAGAGMDLVIVSSPMSQAEARPANAAGALMRQPFRAYLRAEVAALRRTGVPVVAIEPSRQVAQAMGLNPMDARPRGAVSRVTRANVARWLAQDMEGRWLVAMLAVAAASAAAGQEPALRSAAVGQEPVLRSAAVPAAGSAAGFGGTLLPSA
jgi:hypothetical protein